MKKTKIYGVLAALGAALLVSCSPEVSDTKANYAEAEKNAVTTSSDLISVKSGAIDISSGSIDQAGTKSEVELSIFSYTKLNIDTLSTAVKFYSLKDNTNDASYYPMHDEELSAVVDEYSEATGTKKAVTGDDEDTDSGIVTTVSFVVNTTPVTTDTIACFVDAALLKDKKGNAVLNLDDDDKAGEETDSFIDYIGVTADKDGNLTTTLSYFYEEEFDPGFTYFYFALPHSPVPLTDASGNPTGKIRFTADAPVKSEPSAATPEYDADWATALSAMCSLMTKAPDSTTWVTEAVTFTYHDTTDTEYTAHTITADTPVLSYGTQWRVVVKLSPSFNSYIPDWFSKVYGHAGYVFTNTKEFTVLADDLMESTDYSGTSTYYAASPSFIARPYDPDASSEVTFDPQEIKDDDIIAAQNDLLDVTVKAACDGDDNYSSWTWEITPASGVVLSSANDFVVLDPEGNVLSSTVQVDAASDGTIKKVYVDLVNKYYTESGTSKSSGATIPDDVDQPMLFVGHGTTLKENVAYPSQKEFGTYTDVSLPSAIRGYVYLADDYSEVK